MRTDFGDDCRKHAQLDGTFICLSLTITLQQQTPFEKLNKMNFLPQKFRRNSGWDRAKSNNSYFSCTINQSKKLYKQKTQKHVYKHLPVVTKSLGCDLLTECKKWPPITYSFVFVFISLTGLVIMCKIERTLNVKRH